MTVLRGGYVGARTCTGSARPGVKALMAVYLALYAAQGAKNLGIYNCRPIRGTNNTTSLHGEGRAGDHGHPVGATFIDRWTAFLIAMSAELGVQCVINKRRIWSSSFPDGWRPYGGPVPHTDHAHTEQTPNSAANLTVARVWELWNAWNGGGAVPTPAPPPAVGRPVIRKGTPYHDHTRVWQQHLHDNYPAYRHYVTVKRERLISVDGDFGDQTVAWTKEFQERKGLTIDGVVGPQTWRAAGLG